ncbi:hypothetical protein CVT26_004060, partial [Gymnopilus dilepis]
TRTYVQAAVQKQQQHSSAEAVRPRRPRETRIAGNDTGSVGTSRPGAGTEAEGALERPDAAGISADAQDQKQQVPTHFAEYMNRLFSPLQFPPELAQRILTHASHVAARRGHNAAHSFIGRRVLNAYFLMFLNASRHLTPKHDIEQIASSTLHTNLLGEHVAHTWGVGQVLVWAPSAPAEKLAGGKTSKELLRTAGLYKVQGEAVQAIVGGVYQQYGGTVAHRLFHTRVLPLLRVKGGLPGVFHDDAMLICKRMGGETGNLLQVGSTRKSKK